MVRNIRAVIISVLLIILSICIIGATVYSAINIKDKTNIEKSSIGLPEMPDVEKNGRPPSLSDNAMIDGTTKPGNVPGEMRMGGENSFYEPRASENINLNLIQILVIGLSTLVLALSTTYLILSKLGSITLIEAVPEFDKKIMILIIDILVAILITFIILVGVSNWEIRSNNNLENIAPQGNAGDSDDTTERE